MQHVLRQVKEGGEKQHHPEGGKENHHPPDGGQLGGGVFPILFFVVLLSPSSFGVELLSSTFSVLSGGSAPLPCWLGVYFAPVTICVVLLSLRNVCCSIG